MRIRIVEERSIYYLQFLDSKIKGGFGEEFMSQKWLYFGYYDEENQFNRYHYEDLSDAVSKAESLSGPNRKRVVWESYE